MLWSVVIDLQLEMYLAIFQQQNLKQHLPWELCELLRWPVVVCVGLLRILGSPRSVGLTLQVF